MFTGGSYLFLRDSNHLVGTFGVEETETIDLTVEAGRTILSVTQGSSIVEIEDIPDEALVDLAGRIGAILAQPR